MSDRRPPPAQRAALGMRVHSGWAVAVAVAGPGKPPKVVLRKRIELVTPDLPKQPYHAAQSLNLKRAEALVRRCTAAVNRLAQEEVGALIHSLGTEGFILTGAGVLLASGKPLGPLAQTLASHALIHTAEGELFRNAVGEASQHWGLPVTGVKERELYDRFAVKFRKPVDEIQRNVQDMGRALGPPWRADEKLSALVAWLILSEPPG